jgi:hypothetical protein
MTTPAAAVPEPDEVAGEQDELDREEALFRQVMNHVTDQLWAAGVHQFAVALMHDIVGFVLSQHRDHVMCHGRLPEP